MSASEELDDREREILRQRAESFARPEESVRVVGRPAVFFRVGRQRCCAYASSTRGAVRLTGLTAVPGASRAVAGVIVRGGNVIPVFHLSAILGERLDRLPETAHALVLGIANDEAAIAVDLIEGFGDVDADTFVNAPEEARSPFITAATSEGHLVIDLDALLASDALVVDSAPSGGS